MKRRYGSAIVSPPASSPAPLAKPARSWRWRMERTALAQRAWRRLLQLPLALALLGRVHAQCDGDAAAQADGQYFPASGERITHIPCVDCHNADCSWRLDCAAPSVPFVTFGSFDTEANFDYVTLTDGNGERLFRCSGSDGQQCDTTGAVGASSSAWLTSTTDVSVLGEGFSASFECVTLDNCTAGQYRPLRSQFCATCPAPGYTVNSAGRPTSGDEASACVECPPGTSFEALAGNSSASAGSVVGWSRSVQVAGVARTMQARIHGGGMRGVLEVNIDDGGWGAVCDDSFTDNAAGMFCAAMGFSSIGAVQFDTIHGSDNFAIDDVSCSAGSEGLSDCQFPTAMYTDDCTDAETVGVECKGIGTGSCTACTVGRFRGQNNTNCTACPAGSVTSEAVGATACTACPAGQYGAHPGKLHCVPCPEGQFSSQAGASSCAMCPSGNVSSACRTSCVAPCGVGQYRPPTSTECLVCEAPAATRDYQRRRVTMRATHCVTCPAGMYEDAATNGTCVACEAGKYRQSNGTVRCSASLTDTLVCADGSTHTIADGLDTNWGRCATRGGRAQCPNQWPFMCANLSLSSWTVSGQHSDFWCKQTEADCGPHGGVRLCERTDNSSNTCIECPAGHFTGEREPSDDGAVVPALPIVPTRPIVQVAGVARTMQARIHGGGMRGVLEVNIDDGGWGAVCDDSFTDNAAGMFCAAMGFSSIGAVQFDTIHGSDNFAIDDVSCSAGSEGLSDCQFPTAMYTHDCSDAETVGVECHVGDTHGVTWTRLTDTYCSSVSADGYPSQADARAACAASDSCTATYDQGCDGTGWKMCTDDVTSQTLPSSASGSCVDTKDATHTAVDMSMCGRSFAPALPGATHCTLCPVGRYNEQGDASCEVCSIGKYLPVEGGTSGRDCRVCDPGSYTGDQSRSAFGGFVPSHCTLCPAGKFNEKADATCDGCSTGMYGSAPGSISGRTCISCEAGRVSRMIDSQALPGASVMQFDGSSGLTYGRVIVRLAEWEDHDRERLEISVGGRHFGAVVGTIDHHTARILCRTMGFSGSTAHFSYEYTYDDMYSQGEWREAAVMAVSCPNHASSLADCRSSNVPYPECDESGCDGSGTGLVLVGLSCAGRAAKAEAFDDCGVCLEDMSPKEECETSPHSCDILTDCDWDNTGSWRVPVFLWIILAVVGICVSPLICAVAQNCWLNLPDRRRRAREEAERPVEDRRRRVREEAERQVAAAAAAEQLAGMRRTSSVPLTLKRQPSDGGSNTRLMMEKVPTPYTVRIDDREAVQIKCPTCAGAGRLAPGVGQHVVLRGDSSQTVVFEPETMPPTVTSVPERSPLAQVCQPGDVVLRVSYWTHGDPDDQVVPRPQSPARAAPAFDCAELTGRQLTDILSDATDSEEWSVPAEGLDHVLTIDHVGSWLQSLSRSHSLVPTDSSDQRKAAEHVAHPRHVGPADVALDPPRDEPAVGHRGALVLHRHVRPQAAREPAVPRLGRGARPALRPAQCLVCKGTGSVSQFLKSFAAPEQEDEHPCQICYGDSKYGVSTECLHFYCEECIVGSLSAILESGQFQNGAAYCPACRVEATDLGHREPAHGRIEQKALTFLQRHGVIELDFQFRFMRAQDRGSSEEQEQFFACPAECGRYLIDQDPEYTMVPRGVRAEEGFDRKMRLGKCECGARVCVRCHQLAAVETAEDGLQSFVHECPEGLDREVSVDEASMALMAQLGKRCPNCKAFMQKNEGCNVMMCGTTAHGYLAQALQNGGCGHMFYWDSLETANTYFIGLDGTQQHYTYRGLPAGGDGARP